jgi:uncharacterized protein YndB with AHSA1/START domain
LKDTIVQTTLPPANSLRTSLVVRRLIRASPERVFDVWTQAKHLKQWWGPKSVECIDAEVDLRVGGEYRIANKLPDGNVLWIRGSFEVIERPRKLVYTWQVGPESAGKERVTVSFESRGLDTEVIVLHENIPTEAMRDMHQQGWLGCLEGLVEYLMLGSVP